MYRFEGQVSLFNATQGACYRCLFPEPPPPGTVPTCGEGGVFGILPGTIGTIQASEAIKYLLGIGSLLVDKLLLYDALDMSFHVIHLRKNPHCRICSPEATVTELIDYEAFCGSPANDHERGESNADLDISPSVLASRLRRDEVIQLVDVREPVEQQIAQLPGAILIPLGHLASRLTELDPNREIVVFCRTGTRSLRALQILKGAGFQHVWNLWGGINAWATEIDQTLLQY
ncbi:MAG: rhodanese-like domain-containing protein [Anaerolineaceae bacterium]|nr:rhodanese-like domain-containing protein [Anaerolineaceae bacterium]